MLTPEQLERRRKFWTATDSARALTGKYGGLYAVIASKLYGMDGGSTEATEIGNALENSIIDWVANRLAVYRAHLNRQVWVTHTRKALMAATLDAIVGPDNSELHGTIIEVTAPGWASDWTDTDEWGEDGTDQVSEYKMIQAQHQMAVMDADHVYIGAWIRGRGKLLYLVQRDDAFIGDIERYADWAWNTYVEPGVLPEPTEESSELAIRTMQHIERVPAKRIDPTPALVAAVDFYKKVRDNRLAAEKVEEHTKALLLHYMGDAAECAVNDKELLSITDSVTEPSLCSCGAVKREGFKRTIINIKKGKHGNSNAIGADETQNSSGLAQLPAIQG